MRRATTDTHFFELPFDAAIVDKVRLTYRQNDKVVLTKTEKDAKLDGNKLLVDLTQEETTMFQACCNAFAQIRVKTTGGQVRASDYIVIPVLDVDNEEVL